MIHKRLSSPGAALRTLIKSGTTILPGVYDAITAKAAEGVGAKGLYLSGAGVTNSMTAMPDIALITMDEMARQANYVCSAVSLPVIADADTGYGEALNVSRTIQEFERSGLAGCHIEDQVNPKRCGHLDGKQLIETSAMCAKILAAVNARNDSSFYVVARTDARGVNGLSDAIERAQAYVAAGADCIFPEGLVSQEEFKAFRNEVPGDLLANMTEFGKTELISASEFANIGYQLVIFPMTAFRVMLKSVSETYSTLLEEGTQINLLDKMKTRRELYDLIEYIAYENLDNKLSQD